jgi:biotin synthase
MLEPLQTKVYELVEKAVDADGLPDEDIEFLYGVDPLSKEAAFVRWVADRLSREASDNKAEIHAQIGLNSSPCPKNCRFCSFAASNGVRCGIQEATRQEVIDYARAYEEAGANLILILATANYRFEKVLEMAQAVRSVISSDLPLLSNTDDVTVEQAVQLKEVGVNGAYHAVRMREGIDTGIPVEKRLQTFASLEAARLSLSTCVEPVGPEHTPTELTVATRRCIDSGANSAGVGRRIIVPGTSLFESGQISDLRNSYNVAVYRLATGLMPVLNCAVASALTASSGGNLVWAEVGFNPRDTVEKTERGGNGESIAFCRKIYANADWEVLEGPSQGWILD